MPAVMNGEASASKEVSLPLRESRSDSITEATSGPGKKEKMKTTRREGGKEYTVRKSRVMRIVNWGHLLQTYLPYVMLCAVSLLTVQLSYEIYTNQLALGGIILQSRNVLKQSPSSVVLLGMGWKATAVLVVILWTFLRGRRPVYLIDFAVFNPPDSWKCTHEQIVEILKRQKCFTTESWQFMVRGLSCVRCDYRTEF